MTTLWLYTLASVILVSLVSLVGVIALSFKKAQLKKTLLFFVSLSAGTLFGGAILHLLPEAVEKSGFTAQVSLMVIAGILVFFILEKFVHMHHHHYGTKTELHQPHSRHVGILNLAGDGLHNFLDGLVIAGSYLVDVNLGIATTLAVIIHEVPQELADFGVLIYAGFSRRKALILNFISAAIAILGAVIGLLLGTKGEAFITLILPFAAGGFLYIAGSDLIPELHKECEVKDSILQFLAMGVGIALMYFLLFL